MPAAYVDLVLGARASWVTRNVASWVTRNVASTRGGGRRVLRCWRLRKAKGEVQALRRSEADTGGRNLEKVSLEAREEGVG